MTTGKLSNNSVTTDKINGLAVTTEKINDLAVTNGKIADGTIVNAKLVNNTLTFDFDSSVATDDDQTIALGGTVSIPVFSGGSKNGLVNADATVITDSTDTDRAVLSNDGNFYNVQSFALSSTELIPATRITTVGTQHPPNTPNLSLIHI